MRNVCPKRVEIKYRKGKDMFNMQPVTISGIEESGEDDDDLIFHINGHEFSYSEFRESFIPAF